MIQLLFAPTEAIRSPHDKYSLQYRDVVSRHLEDMKNGLGLGLGLQDKVLVLVLVLVLTKKFQYFQDLNE